MKGKQLFGFRTTSTIILAALAVAGCGSDSLNRSTGTTKESAGTSGQKTSPEHRNTDVESLLQQLCVNAYVLHAGYGDFGWSTPPSFQGQETVRDLIDANIEMTEKFVPPGWDTRDMADALESGNEAVKIYAEDYNSEDEPLISPDSSIVPGTVLNIKVHCSDLGLLTLDRIRTSAQN